VGFEPTISAGERPQNYDLDRAATGTKDDEAYQTIIHFKVQTPFVKWAVYGSTPSWEFRDLYAFVLALADIANIWQKYALPSFISPSAITI
jgi:hypothetical protein